MEAPLTEIEILQRDLVIARNELKATYNEIDKLRATISSMLYKDDRAAFVEMFVEAIHSEKAIKFSYESADDPTYYRKTGVIIPSKTRKVEAFDGKFVVAPYDKTIYYSKEGFETRIVASSSSDFDFIEDSVHLFDITRTKFELVDLNTYSSFLAYYSDINDEIWKKFVGRIV
jgi:hypothetical protein